MSEAKPTSRNPAIDAYRGLVMLLLLAEVLEFAHVARSYPTSLIWHILAFNQTHVPWVGMSLHDTVQPSFTFLVGVVLPYSLRSRTARGESFRSSLLHAIRRSLILIALGILLRITWHPGGYFTFIDTLAQIGLVYTFAFLLTYARPRSQWSAIAAILIATWLAYALYQPAPLYDPRSIAANQTLTGFASHWSRGSSFGALIDHWFYFDILAAHTPLARFIVPEPGGYITLNFVPTLATMLFGVIAGRWLLTLPEPQALRRSSLTGLALLAAGLALHLTGICPIVKHLWTPAWTLFSAGVCFLTLAAFCFAARSHLARRAMLPLVVIGMNSIAAYLLSEVLGAHAFEPLRALLHRLPSLASTPLEPTLVGVLILTFEWLTLYALYRRRIFLRI